MLESRQPAAVACALRQRRRCLYCLMPCSLIRGNVMENSEAKIKPLLQVSGVRVLQGMTWVLGEGMPGVEEYRLV